MSLQEADKLQRQMEKIDHDVWKLMQGIHNLEDDEALRVHVRINRLRRKQLRLFKQYNRLNFDELSSEKKVRFKLK